MTRSLRFLILTMLLAPAVFVFSQKQPTVSAADEQWRARYWNNRDLSGDPVKRRDEEAIDYDWGDDSPTSGVNSDDFSARWTRTIYLNQGTYRFMATMDDGMRVWIDDALVIDEWKDSQVRTVSVDLPMTQGDHDIEVRYYEAGGKAVAKFSWAPAGGPPDVPVNRWEGLYFNNQYLSGAPAFTRADNAIDFNWKLDSPWPTIQADHFSVRWTGVFDHDPGTYRFTLESDDGVRLWVNNQLIIDEWQDNQNRTFQADAVLPGGSVPVRLEYYENTGAALVRLGAQKIASGSGSVSPTPSPAQPGLPAEGSAVVTNANWLNVRGAPEMGNNVITAVSRGQVVQLIGRNGGWIKVMLPNGAEGWVASRFLASRTPFTSLPVIN
ncbi:MAG: PA14 domain-containing protein [Candidatus Promineifilaceae bacterium]|jgi:hypothetical protein